MKIQYKILRVTWYMIRLPATNVQARRNGRRRYRSRYRRCRYRRGRQGNCRRRVIILRAVGRDAFVYRIVGIARVNGTVEVYHVRRAHHRAIPNIDVRRIVQLDIRAWVAIINFNVRATASLAVVLRAGRRRGDVVVAHW